MMSERIYIFLFLIIFFLIAFVLRSYLLWKNTGINPITFDDKDDAHGYNGKLFKVILFLELIIMTIYSFGGELSQYLLPFLYLENEYLQWIGWGFLLFALVWTFIAQIQMADSWRIGIDEKNKTDLVTKGFFSISRNPIFLGIIITNIGLFLVVPNTFVLLVATLSFTTIQTQVRLEESFLKEIHGKKYQQYCNQVRRWI